MEPLYFAFTRIALGESTLQRDRSDTAWQTFGFDLDGRCTNSSTCSASSTTQSCRAATTVLPFDGERCRDNTFARLQPIVAAVPELGERFGVREDMFNCNLHRGSYNMLWKVSGYNGMSEDSSVRVDFYVALGLSQPPPWQCPLEDYDRYPAWRTVDAWRIDPEFLTEPISSPGTLPDSTVADARAYVRGGYLIVRPPDGALTRLADDGQKARGFALRTQQGIWTGKLSHEQDDTWRVRDGLAAGRVLGEDLIQSFRQVGLCEDSGSGFYEPVVEYIQQNLDVLADGASDPNRDCNAMSFGIAFEAAQATPGEVVPAASTRPLVECCPPGTAFEDCSPKCGDGRVNGDEKCDTAIEVGTGSCPRVCPSIDACTPMRLVGSGCGTLCEAQPITVARPNDGCCPPGADESVDPDCGASCGTPVDCDDGDPCTVDSRTASGSDCNFTCTHVPVAVAASGDLCCPSSATELECDASCGDGVRNGVEECDDGNVIAGDGCSPNCTSESLAQQCAALDPRTLGSGRDACAACICDACAAEAIACYTPLEPEAAAACKAVVECGVEHDCSGTACFCGTANPLACLRGGGNGPCRSEIETASGSASVSEVMARSNDAMYPLGRANALGACGEENCAAACASREEQRQQ